MLEQTLTKRQQTIFKYIRKQILKNGFGPTIRDIQDEMGFKSPNGVVCHLRALENKGLITRQSHKSRSIVLSDEANEELSGLPLAGRVAAGALMEAVEQHERIDVGKMWKHKSNYVLEVEGDSMIDANIQSGDYVVVRKRNTASKGDIVVARTSDGDATLKYWFPEKNRVRLQPANKKMKPIYRRDAKVIGVVVGVIRNFQHA